MSILETGAAGGRILIERRGDALWLTINTPENHNTMTPHTLGELAQAFDAASRMKGLRAIVLTGAGERTFCAGGQLTPSADGSPFELVPEQFDNPVALLFRAMDRCEMPIVGRINGGAFGGGVGLLCACDIAIGVDTASFGTTEARVGVFPLMILPLLMRVVSRRDLVEMCFYAQKFDAHKAVRIGLLNDAVAAGELDSAVEAVLARLRLNSPTSLKIGRRAINAVTDLALGDALNATQALLPLLAQSAHAKEGFRAFQEKRSPVWD